MPLEMSGRKLPFAAISLGMCLAATGPASADSLAFLGTQGDLRRGADPLPEATGVLDQTLYARLKSGGEISKLVGPAEAARLARH